MSIRLITSAIVIGSLLATGAFAHEEQPGKTMEKAKQIRTRSSGMDRLYSTSDVNYYKFTVEKTRPVTIYSVSWENIWAPDLYAELLDKEGNVLAQDDNGGRGRNFSIQKELQPGDYYLKVTLQRDFKPYVESGNIPDYSVFIQ